MKKIAKERLKKRAKENNSVKKKKELNYKADFISNPPDVSEMIMVPVIKGTYLEFKKGTSKKVIDKAVQNYRENFHQEE